jgi:hypothetical protein
MKKVKKIIMLALIVSGLGLGHMFAQEMAYVGGCPNPCQPEGCNINTANCGTCSGACVCVASAA